MTRHAVTVHTPPAASGRSLPAHDDTRARLLAAAFAEIHRSGFQGASLERILADTGLTKGALYHHFQSKLELGYAVVEEVIAPQMRAMWLDSLHDAADPLDAMIGMLRNAARDATRELIEVGCPLNNLAQEMSPLDEGFRLRLDYVAAELRDGFESALERGKRAGIVRADVDAKAAALFVIAAMEGCVGMAKNAQSLDVLKSCGQGLIQYLTSLHAPARSRKSAASRPKK